MRYKPGVHSEQPEAPVADWYWPAPEQNKQASKELAPSTTLYRPTRQPTQVPAEVAAKAVEYVPCPHMTQAKAPEEVAYLPAEQLTQALLPKPAI